MKVRHTKQAAQPPDPTWPTLLILASVSVSTLVVTRSPQDIPLVLAPTLVALDYLRKGTDLWG